MKNNVTRRLLYNNKFIFVSSVVVAILFWLFVVINVSPDYKRTIYGAQISIEENSQSLTALGLHVVDKSTDKVSITVTGPRNVIGRLTGSSFSVTPELSMISKAGSYELKLNAVLKSPDNRVRITKISPAYVTVKFDTMQVKNLPVNVQVEDNKVPDGYIMQTAESNPKTITISGPTSELSQVAKAQAKVKIGDNTKETTVINSKIILLDSGGNELNLEHIQMSQSSVQITVPILKTKQLPLKVSFTNIPEGFDTNNIMYEVTPSSIDVAGNADKIDAINEINMGSINFEELDITSTKMMNIPNIEGIMNIENVETAYVKVMLKNTSTKMMSTSNFTVVGQPAGYRVTVKTKQIKNIKLFGPSSDIDNVTTINAIIDLSNVQNGTGQYEVPVTFKVPGRSGYWVTGSYSAVVSIRKY